MVLILPTTPGRDESMGVDLGFRRTLRRSLGKISTKGESCTVVFPFPLRLGRSRTRVKEEDGFW